MIKQSLKETKIFLIFFSALFLSFEAIKIAIAGISYLLYKTAFIYTLPYIAGLLLGGATTIALSGIGMFLGFLLMNYRKSLDEKGKAIFSLTLNGLSLGFLLFNTLTGIIAINTITWGIILGLAIIGLTIEIIKNIKILKGNIENNEAKENKYEHN